LVLPSPNGAALCFSANHRIVLTACLRNAAAVADSAMRLGKTFGVIPAGEKWEDGTLRPSLEDWLGAGAVISALSKNRSPEAQLAAAGFDQLRSGLDDLLRACGSGKELIERGFEEDVTLAAGLNCSRTVPKLIDRAFVDLS
jgi:2-phosphosulfolactate phosphatase